MVIMFRARVFVAGKGNEMLKRLEAGQQVEFTPAHQTGMIKSVQNDGQVGIFKASNGACFTVFAGECRESGAPLDVLEELCCSMPVEGIIWQNPYREPIQAGKPSDWRLRGGDR
jgi:hypothetical protein